jgi:type II secretory pathway pseudopilin PulG
MELSMKAKNSQAGEQGYVLLAVMLLITLMIIAMSVEMPRIVQQIKRAKEDELVHRGKEYAMAIKRFYHKNGRYPNSIDQLMNTNNVRFLRKKYKDPINNSEEWHLVRLGEAQITVPPPNPGLQGSGGPVPTGTPPPGGNIVPNTSGAGGGSGQSNSSKQLGTLTVDNTGGGQSLGGAPIIGVASTSEAEGIKEFHEKTHYNEWLFVFDPRLEASGTGVTVAEPAGAGAAGVPPGAMGTLNPSPTPTPK